MVSAMSFPTHISRGCAVAAVAAVVATTGEAREKTDLVVCKNGDRLLCEIKELDLGLLRVKTSTMSTVYVKWEHVSSLSSKFGYLVETDEGRTYVGSFVKNDRDEILSIYTQDGQVDLYMGNVARITPVGRSFFERLDGSFDLGFNYTKSTDIAQLYSGFSTTYRREKYLLRLDFDTNVTTNSQEGAKRRADLNGTYRRFYPDRYYANYTIGGQRNDELGINLRTYATGAFGRYFEQSSHQEFSGEIGLSGNNENTTDAGSNENLESVFGLAYAFIRFKDPEANITSSVDWYPSLSDWGRHRLEADLKLKYELVDDFFWSLTFYYSYDSRPPDGASAKDDYGIVNSLGYSW